MSDFSDERPGVDLFGQPSLPIKDRRGRPSFKKDKQNQDFVAVRIAAGWTHKRIAENMGIDEKTLRKYFSRELEYGAVFIEGVVLDVLLRRTREGHAPSVRQLREVAVEGKRREAERSMGSPAEEKASPTERPGKKAMDAQRAVDADADLMAELEQEASQNAHH
jgi:predicted transcriptional regulator